MGALISNASLSLHRITILQTVRNTLHVSAGLGCDAFIFSLQSTPAQVCVEQSIHNSFLAFSGVGPIANGKKTLQYCNKVA